MNCSDLRPRRRLARHARILLATALVVVIAPLTPPAAQANGVPQTYWVSPSGNDTFAGTQAQPFKTITHAAKVAGPLLHRRSHRA